LDSILLGAESYYGEGYDESGYKYELNLYINEPGEDAIAYLPVEQLSIGDLDGGHAFVGIEKENGFTGETEQTIQGLYPVEPGEIADGVIKGNTFKGDIRDDSSTKYDYKYSFNISGEGYTAARIYMDISNEKSPQYNLYTNNCTDYSVSVANRAFINLPDAGGIGSLGSSPFFLNNYLHGNAWQGWYK
jgi:hypothetical protein